MVNYRVGMVKELKLNMVTEIMFVLNVANC